MGKIADLITEEFLSVYCNSCKYAEVNDEEACESCHRKAMNWSISDDKANNIENKILEIIKEL